MPTTYEPQIPEKKEYLLLPEDIYIVEVGDITDEERPVYNKPDETEKVMKFQFVVIGGEFDGQSIFMNVKPTLFPGNAGLSPSALYQILSAVNGKALDDEDLQGVTTQDINNLIHKEIRVVVKHRQTDKGDTRHKVESFLPMK